MFKEKVERAVAHPDSKDAASVVATLKPYVQSISSSIPHTFILQNQKECCLVRYSLTYDDTEESVLINDDDVEQIKISTKKAPISELYSNDFIMYSAFPCLFLFGTG